MRIVVIGASKGIGAALLDQAWSAGHHVVAVGRGVSVGERGNVTPIQGSILDPGVAERAVAGADGVAWCVGNRQLGPAALRKVTLFSEGRDFLPGSCNAGTPKSETKRASCCRCD